MTEAQIGAQVEAQNGAQNGAPGGAPSGAPSGPPTDARSAAQSDHEPPARYRDVFAEPVFRVLFLSRSFAIGAGTLRILALSVLVFDRTGSPLLTAITFGVGFVPQVVGGTLFGALADRWPPRRLIV